MLGHSEALSWSMTCRSMASLSTNESVWQSLCAQIWLIIEKPSSTTTATATTTSTATTSAVAAAAEITWCTIFRQQSSLYGITAISSFSRVASLWRRFETFFAVRAPAILAMIAPPMNDRDAHLFDQKCASLQLTTGIAVPIEWRISMKLHDGQRKPSARRDVMQGNRSRS